MFKATSLFTAQLKEPFCCFAVNKLFKDKHLKIIVGHENGIVRTYDMPESGNSQQPLKIQSSYETKGGPIQFILVDDITNLSTNDLVAADSEGQVTFLYNGQILSRRKIFNTRITNTFLVKDATGAPEILALDLDGNVCLFDRHDEIWQMKFGDDVLINKKRQQRKVTSMCYAVLNTSHGSKVGYILIADDSSRLSFYFNNNLVLVLPTPDIITAMCPGRFVSESHFSSQDNKDPFTTQVMLGTEDGSMYILANFQIRHEALINVQFPIRHLRNYADAKRKISNGDLDLVVVAGNSDSYCVIECNKELVRGRSTSCIDDITISDIDGDGFEEIIFSCKDGSIHAHRIDPSSSSSDIDECFNN